MYRTFYLSLQKGVTRSATCNTETKSRATCNTETIKSRATCNTETIKSRQLATQKQKVDNLQYRNNKK